MRAQGRKAQREQAAGDYRGLFPRGSLVVIIALVCMASSSTLLHESASWQLDYVEIFGQLHNVRAYSCDAHSVGLIIGFAASLLSWRRLQALARNRVWWVCFFVVQFVLVGAFYAALAHPAIWPAMVAIQIVGAASSALFVIICVQVVRCFSPRQMIMAVMLVFALMVALVHGLFSTLEEGVPQLVSEVLHLALVAGAALGYLAALRTSSVLREAYEADELPIRVQPEHLDDEVRHRLPVYFRLFAIVGTYSCVFGFLHVIPLALPLGVYARVITFVLGAIAALALYAWTVRPSDVQNVANIWNRFYRFVFPVVTIAALLGPLTATTEFLPSLVMQAWALYYFDTLLATASYTIARTIKSSPAQVFGRAFFIRAIGFFCGNIIGSIMHESVVVDAATFSVIGAVVFGLLTLVTFNMNSEKYAKTVWGLIPHEDPRAKMNRALDERCEEVAREFGLTERESEILRHLSRDKRPKEISEVLVVSVATVRSHVQGIYSKTGAHSYEELDRLLNKR